MRGIFIGFDPNKKGYLFYMPGSRNIMSSADAIFDESFHSAIATTLQQHRDTLALQPMNSYIPDITMVLEHTGTINDNSADVEEGEIIEIAESFTMTVSTKLLQPQLRMRPIVTPSWTISMKGR